MGNDYACIARLPKVGLVPQSVGSTSGFALMANVDNASPNRINLSNR